MLSQQECEDFETRGVLVLPKFLPETTIRQLLEAIDSLQAGAAYGTNGRWDMRNCLPRHGYLIDLLGDQRLSEITIELLRSSNIKMLGSHIVKMQTGGEAKTLPVSWHRDGGVLLAELPDPLPPLFIKTGFCISGTQEPEAGELLVVPGSNRLIGSPVSEPDTGWPLGFSRILMSPGDAMILDWRTWHAVSRNASNIVRRTLYFTFGYRWLSAMDYQVMPEELLNLSPVYKQLLGGGTELGNYLPTADEIPLRIFDSEPVN